MNLVTLDARHWKTADDFFTALLRQLGAPAWHGKNLNALRDTMIFGGVNQIDPPMRVEVTGLSYADPEAFDMLIAAFSALAKDGANAHITGDRATLEILSGS